MKQRNKLLSILIFIIVALAFIGFGIDTSITMPPNAIVVVDEDKKVYFAPTFFEDNELPLPVNYKKGKRSGRFG